MSVTLTAIEESAEKARAHQQRGVYKIEGNSIGMIGQIEGVEHYAGIRLSYCNDPE